MQSRTAEAAAASKNNRSLASKNDSVSSADVDDIKHAMGLPSNINLISHTTRATMDATSQYKAVGEHLPVYRSLAVQAPLVDRPIMHPTTLKKTNSAGPALQKGRASSQEPGFVSFGGKSKAPEFVVVTDKKSNPKVQEVQKIKAKPTTIVAGPMPIILNEHTSTLVKGYVTELAKCISDIFVDLDVDVQFDNEKCEWNGHSYHKNRKLIFCAVLYRNSNTPGDQIHVLEFQRRKGDFVQFLNLYQDMYEALLRSHRLCDKQGSLLEEKNVQLGPRKTLDLLPLPPGVLDDFQITMEAFEPLVQMADSEYVDVQAEALREIANIAADDSSRPVLGKFPNLMNILLKGVTSLDSDVRRCSCAAIESFSKDSKFQRAIAEKGGIQKICDLLSTAHVETIDRETQRVACNAAACLAPLYRDSFYDCDGISIFQNLANNSPDVKIRSCASSVCKCL